MRYWHTLIDVHSLAGLDRQDVRVLDCRAVLGDAQAGFLQYRDGHLPGALFACLERDFSDMQATGQGRHPWPQATDFARTVANWGIREHTQVVLYDADNGMFAARGWALLQLAGHARAAVLDGGLRAWCEAGYPLEDTLGHALSAPQRPLRFCRERLFDHQDVMDHLAYGGLLVDARLPARFRGEIEPTDEKAGHVPGAHNRPFVANLTEHGHFKSSAELFAEFAELLVGRTPSDMVVMCGSGVTACHHLLAMAHAGLDGGKLYKGSWSGWISDPTRPLAIGE